MTSQLEIFTTIQKLLNEINHYSNEHELLDDVCGDAPVSEKNILAVREIIHTYWKNYGIRKELYRYLDCIYSNLIYAMNNIDGMAVDRCVLRNDDGAMCFAAYTENIQGCIGYVDKLLLSCAEHTSR